MNKNHLISKWCNFFCRHRMELGNSAKRIYFIQRIFWKNFQVWVLTKNSSFAKKWWLRKNGKIVKIRFFENDFWDEFLLGWVLTLKNGETDVWNDILSHVYDLFTLWNIFKNYFFREIFQLFFSEFQNFKISKKYSWIKISVPICSKECEMIISLPQKKMHWYNDIFMTTHKKIWKCLKILFSKRNLLWRAVPRDEFLSSEKFFHQKVWVLKNIFNIYHVLISSIHQKLLNYLLKKPLH